MRVRLYHYTVPVGVVFTDAESLAKATTDGWVDSPFKIKKDTPAPQDVKAVMVESPKDIPVIAPSGPGTGASLGTPWAVPPATEKKVVGRPFKKAKGGR